VSNILNNNSLISNRFFYIRFYIKKNKPKINQKLIILIKKTKIKIIKSIFQKMIL